MTRDIKTRDMDKQPEPLTDEQCRVHDDDDAVIIFKVILNCE